MKASSKFSKTKINDENINHKKSETKASSRRTQPALGRAQAQIEEKPNFLIVCEGANTETSYFKAFRLSSAKIKAVGTGRNCSSLIQKAKELSEKGKYDEVWCVFDKDSFPAEDFNAAIELAKSYNFGAAYSNQSFEYWLILHFEDHQGGGMSRTDYEDKINRYIEPLGAHYDGQTSKLISIDFFNILEGIDPVVDRTRRKIAIGRARRIAAQWAQTDATPSNMESVTMVFSLVQKIMRYI